MSVCVVCVYTRLQDIFKHVLIGAFNDFVVDFFCSKQAQVSQDSETDSVHVLFSENRPLVVADDVRFMFYCSTVRVLQLCTTV